MSESWPTAERITAERVQLLFEVFESHNSCTTGEEGPHTAVYAICRCGDCETLRRMFVSEAIVNYINSARASSHVLAAINTLLGFNGPES